jgi:hypothetical protein
MAFIIYIFVNISAKEGVFKPPVKGGRKSDKPPIASKSIVEK